jgi:hypothetical protein
VHRLDSQNVEQRELPTTGMTATNEFSVANGDVALVGARFSIEFGDGRDTATGRTAEVLVRRGVEWL